MTDKAKGTAEGPTQGAAGGRRDIDVAFGRALLRWFDKNKRDLPWRRERTPYRVWVSEVMLQQTRVDTVVPYYERFMQAFPTVEALAASSEADVLKLWEGLGYYRRARDLRRAAQIVVDRFHGELPEDPELLRTLPGIGPYTAAAVASIAYNVPAPAVDGNVLRVIARLAGVDDVITSAAARRRVEDAVAALTPTERAGDATEALMELGALVCLPRNPLCGACPWQATCVALMEDRVEELPRRPERVRLRVVHGSVAVVHWDGRALVRRRPEDGLLAGLWEFPWFEHGARQRLGADGVAEALHREYGVAARPTGALAPMRHVFSHLEWRLHVFTFEADGGPGRPVVLEETSSGEGPTVGWAAVDRLTELAFGRAHRRIADAWRDGIAGKRSGPDWTRGGVDGKRPGAEGKREGETFDAR